MNLDEWRQAREHGEEGTLPSGLEVRLKRVSVLDLAQSGRIPQVLRPWVNELMQQKAGQQMGLEELGELADVVDLVVKACLVGPVGLDVAELPWADRLAIYLWANEATGRLETFRQQNGKSVGAPFAVGELRPKAK